MGQKVHYYPKRKYIIFTKKRRPNFSMDDFSSVTEKYLLSFSQAVEENIGITEEFCIISLYGVCIEKASDDGKYLKCWDPYEGGDKYTFCDSSPFLISFEKEYCEKNKIADLETAKLLFEVS